MIKELEIQDRDVIKQLVESFPSFFNVASIEDEYKSNPYVHYLIYQLGEKIVGYLNYSLIYDRIEINQFRVLEEMQGKGIGTSLMKGLIDEASKLSLDNITLEVRCNNTKAISIYRKFGFQEKATRKGYYGKIDGILMEKEMIK